MKKSFVFSICFVLVLVALAFTIGAAPTFGEMEDAIDTIPNAHVFGDGTNPNVTHKDGYYNESCAKVILSYNDTTVTYPSYYILKNDTTLIWSFDKISQALGVEIGVGNIVAMQIPYGITDIPEMAFVLPGAFDATVTEEHPKGRVATPNTVLEYVFLSNSVLNIKDFAFAHCTSLTEIGSNVSAGGATGDHNHQMLHSIGYRAFHDCGGLTSFNFNNHLTILGEGCFEGCSITKINLSKCIELTVIPKNCFHESNASDVSEIILPTSIKEIQDNAFTGASAQKVFLGTSLEIVGRNAIVMSDVDILILPATIKTIYKDSIDFGNNSYDPYIVGARSKEEVEALFKVLTDAEISLKQINNPSKVYNDSAAFFSDSENVFCISYLGGHTINHNSNSITSVVYPNGIEHQGYATGSCGVCFQELGDATIKLTPILVSKGFSICTYNGLYAFSNGFEVYHDALAVYERVNGLCEIGIVFMLNSRYEESYDLRNDIDKMGLYFDENSLMTEGQITYESIDYKMTYSKGLVYEDANGNTVNRGALELVIAGYMLHKEAKAGDMYNKSYYVQDADDIYIAGKTTDDKYNTVSYDSIYGTAKSQGLL